MRNAPSEETLVGLLSRPNGRLSQWASLSVVFPPQRLPGSTRLRTAKQEITKTWMASDKGLILDEM